MTEKRILILGIGNILWADEGFGVRVVQSLQQRYAFPPTVTVMDGGTQGLALIPYVQEADVLMVVDAVDFHLEPGSLVELRDEEVPAYLGAKKMSLHQVSFQEVLALCQLMGRVPERLCLIGVQPLVLDDYGGSLSAVVKARIEPAIERVLGFLDELAISVEQRDASHSGPDLLDMTRYEQQRPSAATAYRFGDPRFVTQRDGD
ncbi:MAG: hydrogenase expression/formation protein [Proteobacteria bacterium]|nr:hydrogenase expression/formation protein [Pseudomonadota bacterium]